MGRGSEGYWGGGCTAVGRAEHWELVGQGSRVGGPWAGVSCVLLPSPLQYQSRGLVKAPGKSSFTMFVDLGIYQPGGSGDTIPITGEDGRTDLR